jgi:hypothetical protein
MVAFLDVGCRSPGRSLRPPPPTESLFFAHAEACFGHTVGLPSEYEIGRSALDTLCAFGNLRLCLRVPLQRRGRRFTEGGTVRHRKAPKLNELMTSGDLRDARCGGISTSQRRASPVQSSQQEIPRGAYAEEFGATHSQRPLRYADLCAKSGHAESLVSAFAEHFFKTNHNGSVMVSCFWIFVRLVGGQAIDDRVKHFLLQRSCHLGALDQFPSSLCKVASFSEEKTKS